MNIDEQIELLRAQKPVEAHPEEDLLKIFSAASYLFRRFISPITPAQQLQKNLAKILLLCRLENNENAYALVLRARAAAQLEGSVMPSNWDDIMRSTGMDILPKSTNCIASGGLPDSAKTGVTDIDTKDGFVLTYGTNTITIVGGSKNGSASTTDFLEACELIDELNVRASGGQRNVSISYGDADTADDVEIFDTVHDPWLPTTVYSKRLKQHPTPIIEPSTLVATSNPKPTYRPLLPVEAIERGFISDAQFETIVYGLQAITEYLPGSPMGPRGPKVKGGYIIGDGTGVGKTNEFCGIIMDQYLRGQKRHIVVVERSKHVEHVKEAWSMIGGDPKNIMFQGSRGASEELPAREGIMITTYALIRDEKRYRALLDWANDQELMGGVLVFDEAHNMRNAVEDKHKEGSGRKNRSQQGMAGVELQDDLPNAGVIYASATMATDVYNLGYAARLGLWGENAPFSSAEDFISQMHNLDEAALEQICIDLKSAGRYCSRTLSFDGVEYDEIEHRLTPRQRERFDETVNSWKTYTKMSRAATKACTKGKIEHRGSDTAVRIKNQRYTVERLLTQFNIDTLIEDMHEELAKGNCPVVQISMTGEAMMNRIVGSKKELTIEEYRENGLKSYIENGFPIHYLKKEGTNWVLDLDDNGDPVECAEAVRIREDALRMAEGISLDMNAMDRLYVEFGVDQVAEMTGRSTRMIPVMKNGKLDKWEVKERSSADAVADVEAFQNGKKSILMFSLGAGGTGLSYHAGRDVPNKRRRIHYILELGRRSESAVQGIGRTHRSGQVIAPFVKMVTSDIPAQAIYSSKTLAKIAKMGALSRGHQHATTNAIFEQRVPLHSIYASRGWKSLIEAIGRDEIEGFTIEQLTNDLQVEKLHEFDTVLSRLALMTDGDQRQLMKELHQRTDEAMSTAIRNGEFNQGLETINAKSIQIVDENQIDNANGSKTHYYRLQKHEEINKITFSKAMMMYTRANQKANTRNVFMKHRVNGRIALGIMQDKSSSFVDVTTPAGTSTRTANALRQEPWKVVSDLKEAERHWNDEYETLDIREYSDLHMLSGSLLYNWDKLPKTGIGLTRCKTDAGQVIVGRMVSKFQIKPTLQSLGMRSNYKPAQIAKMLSEVNKGANIDLDNKWVIDRPQGSTNYRLDVPVEDQTGPTRHSLEEIGVIPVATPLGMEFEIEPSRAIDIIQQLAIGSDLNVRNVSSGGNGNVALAAMTAFPS